MRETTEMETLRSETKKRILPSWMTAQEVEKRAVPVKTSRRRRTVEPARAARRLALKTVYCMNEAEMVDTALAILLEGRTWEQPREELAVRVAEKAELRPTGPWSPHTSSGGNSGEEDSGSDSPALSLSPCQRPGTSTSACSRNPEPEEEEKEEEGQEEDMLKYVKEIFFS